MILTHRFAFAGALALTIIYGICALLFYFMPDMSLAFTAQFLLLRSLELFTPYIAVTIPNIISGSVQTFVFTYAIAWLWATLYNRGLPQ